jgi:hypothetical protein
MGYQTTAAWDDDIRRNRIAVQPCSDAIGFVPLFPALSQTNVSSEPGCAKAGEDVGRGPRTKCMGQSASVTFSLFTLTP